MASGQVRHTTQSWCCLKITEASFSLALLFLNVKIFKEKAWEWSGFYWIALVYIREHKTHKTGINFEVSLVSHWWKQLYDSFIYLLIVERDKDEEDEYNEKEKRTKKKKKH